MKARLSLILVLGVACGDQVPEPAEPAVKVQVTPKPVKEASLTRPQSGLTRLQERWVLALNAVLTQRNGEVHELLASRPKTPASAKATVKLVSEWWGIDDRASLIESMDWIEKGGHRKGFQTRIDPIVKLSDQEFAAKLRGARTDEERVFLKYLRDRRHLVKSGKSILSWDYARYISLCRWGVQCGFMSEREAWYMILPKAKELFEVHESWQDVGERYLDGRKYWSPETITKTDNAHEAAFTFLKGSSFSPWQQLDYQIGKTIDFDAVVKRLEKQILADARILDKLDRGYPGRVASVRPCALVSGLTIHDVTVKGDDGGTWTERVDLGPLYKVGQKVTVRRHPSQLIYICPPGAGVEAVADRVEKYHQLVFEFWKVGHTLTSCLEDGPDTPEIRGVINALRPRYDRVKASIEALYGPFN